LPGGAQGTGNRNQPQGDKHDRARYFRAVAPAQPAVQHRDQPGDHGDQNQQKQLGLQALGADASFDAPRAAHDHHQAALEEAFAIEILDQRRQREAVELELFAQQHIQQDTAGHGDQAHDHRRIQAMPDRQAVLGQLTAHHRLRRSGKQRADGLRRENPHRQAGEHQQFNRGTHPARWLVGGMGQVGRGRAEEHIHREAQGISHTECTGDGRNHRQGDFHPGR